MMSSIQLGTKVRHLHDEGWGSPGCVLSIATKVRVFWPDENVFTEESLADLVPYGLETARPPGEVAA